MRNFILIILTFWGGLFSNAQYTLKFNINWDQDSLQLNHNYILGSDTISISDLKFYISGLQIGSKKIPGAFLLDYKEPEKLYITLPVKLKSGDSLFFKLGIDSADTYNTNWTGPLDPAHGMYWAWNTGYINWKMEGCVSSSPEFHNGLFCHIGGYMHGQKCEQQKILIFKNEIYINLKSIVSYLIESKNTIFNIREKMLLIVPALF